MKMTYETDVYKDISHHVGKKAVLKGWVYNKRFSGKIGFLQLRDGSGFIQAVISAKEVSEGTWELANKLTLEVPLSLKEHRPSTLKKRNMNFRFQI